MQRKVFGSEKYIQANVRTYQKWENGETKPDGYFLLRILNWLDINDIQSLTEWLK